MAEPNVPGKPSAGTWAKIVLAFLILAAIFLFMMCASLGMPM